MSVPVNASKALGVLLLLTGAVITFFGVIITVMAIFAIATGDWFGHPGGVPLLVFGVVLGALGILALRKGLKLQGE